MMGRARGQLGFGIRSLVVDNYIPFYRVREETIRIIRILHGARKIKRSMMKE
jgi:plasmid stabilization system protein ParE